MTITWRGYVRYSFAIGSLAVQACIGGYAAAKPPTDEIATISDKIIENGQKLVSASLAKITDPWDRSVILSQMSMLIFYGRGCSEVKSYFEKTPELRGGSIEKITYLSGLEGKLACYAELAPLILERSDDPLFGRSGQTVLRYQAGAMLDLVGDPRGKQIWQNAEISLRSEASPSELWRARYAALNVYTTEPMRTNYLLFLSERLEAERPSRNYFYTVLVQLAGMGRCDLVEHFLNNGPDSCKRYKETAANIATQDRQPAPSATPTFEMVDSALAEPNPKLRMARLVGLASLWYRARVR